MTTSARTREASLVRRPWTRAERRVVWHGLFGRLAIAVEPVICCLVFGVIVVAVIMHPPPSNLSTATANEATRVLGRSPSGSAGLVVILASIFGLGCVCFFGYAIALLVAPVHALLQTFSPIYIVDGYIRYRRPDRDSDPDANGYVAVLNEDRRMLAEWPTFGDVPLWDSVRPALVEFSLHGGIHRIDGKSTGVLPEKVTPLGVGAFR